MTKDSDRLRDLGLRSHGNLPVPRIDMLTPCCFANKNGASLLFRGA